MGKTFGTSKKNALASLKQYIHDNVLDVNESLFLGNYEQAIQMPCFSFIDKGAPDLPPTAFSDDLGSIFPGSVGYQGRISQTVVEINIMDKTTSVSGSQNPNAEKNIYLMRERLRRALYYAGDTNFQGCFIYPNIQLLDYDTNGHPSTGSFVWWPSEESNTWFESVYLASSDDPQLKRIQLAIRIRWFETQP
jgi:hypothetical protein